MQLHHATFSVAHAKKKKMSSATVWGINIPEINNNQTATIVNVLDAV